MSAIGGEILLQLIPEEAGVLDNLVTQLILLVQSHSETPLDPDPVLASLDIGGTDELPEDPALARLFPNAFADRDDASRFRRTTEQGLVNRKLADAEVVSNSLTEHRLERIVRETDGGDLFAGLTDGPEPGGETAADADVPADDAADAGDAADADAAADADPDAAAAHASDPADPATHSAAPADSAADADSAAGSARSAGLVDHEVSIAVSGRDFEAWIRTLTALRLAMAARIDITDASDHARKLRDEETRASVLVYDWLGVMVEGFLQLHDEA